jgi:FkbM family methyltransferase
LSGLVYQKLEAAFSETKLPANPPCDLLTNCLVEQNMNFRKRVTQIAIKVTSKILKYEIKILGGKRGELISSTLANEFAPVVLQQTDIGKISFFCPGNLPVRRARSLLTKEPMTIEWIMGFKVDDIFWDIGANIGVYSLFAANRRLNVLSFEPSPSNFYLLSKNIEINRFDDRISAFCIAFSDYTIMDEFYMRNSELGGSQSTFAEAVDSQGQMFKPSFKKAMLGFSIDYFIDKFNPPFPNHIKIDVDGAEGRIVEGAQKTLNDKRLKSILIELDPKREDYYRKVKEIIENSGMVHYVSEPIRPSKERKQVTVGNHIFIRS